VWQLLILRIIIMFNAIASFKTLLFQDVGVVNLKLQTSKSIIRDKKIPKIIKSSASTIYTITIKAV
jgi:hypothetical protein